MKIGWMLISTFDCTRSEGHVSGIGFPDIPGHFGKSNSRNTHGGERLPLIFIIMVLIIGYGNPLRGDDGVGWRVVEEIQRQKAGGRGQKDADQSSTFNHQSIEAVAYHQLMPELAEAISRAQRVIFVDAAVGEPAGAVTVRPLPTRPPQPGAFTHQVDPAGLLAYAELLYGRAPTAHLVTINADRMGYEETLSPIIEAALPGLLLQITQLAVS